MGKHKDLSEFDNGQTVMDRLLAQIISKPAALLGCSRSAAVSLWWVGNRVIEAHGEWRLACVARSNRWATVAQTAEKVSTGSYRKVSEYKVHHSLLLVGLQSCWPVRVPMLTLFHLLKCQQWAHEHQKLTMDQWKTGLVWWITFSFASSGWPGVYASLPWGTHAIRMHYGEKASRQRQCDALDNVLLGNLGSCHPWWCYFDMYHLLAVASFSRIMRQAIKQQWVRNDLRSTTCLRCWLGLQIPQIQSSIRGMCWTNKSDPWRPHLATYRT